MKRDDIYIFRNYLWKQHDENLNSFIITLNKFRILVNYRENQ